MFVVVPNPSQDSFFHSEDHVQKIPGRAMWDAWNAKKGMSTDAVVMWAVWAVSRIRKMIPCPQIGIRLGAEVVVFMG